jgi:hypothetical protein
MLDCLFHRVEQHFDGRPTLLILDEAWLFLKRAAAQEERFPGVMEAIVTLEEASI